MARIWFDWSLRGAAAMLLLLSCTRPTSAQTRLYILFAGDGVACPPTDCEPSRVLEIDVDGRRVLANTPVLYARQYATVPVITADGRYLAWIGTENSTAAPSYLSVFDTMTRWQTPLARTSARGISGALFADPAAVRLFSQFQLDSPLTILDPQGTRGMAVPCAGAALTAISGNGARLFVGCGVTTTATARTFALDSATGITVGTVPEAGSYSAVDDDGSHYYAASWPLTGTGTVLSRYDVATGQLLARRTIADAYPAGPLVLDPRSGRVYVGVAGQAAGIRVYDGETFADLARLSAPIRDVRASVVIDPDRPFAFVVWNTFAATPMRSRITMYETDAFSVVAEADLGNDTPVVGMALGPRPPRAENLTANVTGRLVTLAWTNQATRSLASGLVVEAGSAPGRSDLASLPVAAGQNALTVPDVPPGTYYVRVRSVNGSGVGDPSNELTVVVP